MRIGSMRIGSSCAAALLALAGVMAGGSATAAATAGDGRAEAGRAAPTPLLLRVTYETRSIGADGVQRDSRYSNLLFRDADTVWIERELPAAVREHAAHGHAAAAGPHAGHAHQDAQRAPLLLQRRADGQIAVQSVLQALRRVIDVEPAHYGNVGYGGSWDAAWGLIDAQALGRMEPLGGPRGGVQRYRLHQGERTVQVDWDLRGGYARRIEQSDAHGLSTRRMTASALPVPATMPWQKLQGYERGDYSDLLD